MSYFIKQAYAVLTFIDNKPSWFRKVDVLVEDESIKCVNRHCDKPRDAVLINGFDKVVTPSLSNALIEPKSILTKSLGETSFTDEQSVKALTRTLCLIHLLNGLTGFVSFSDLTIDPNVCADLLIRIANVRKINLSKRVSPGNDLYGLDLCDEEIVRRIKDVAIEISGKKPTVVKTSINRHVVFLFKKTTGHYPLEFIFKEGIIGNESLITHLNWVTLAELNVLKDVKPTVVAVPSSSLALGEGGFTPLKLLHSMGIPIALSSDLFYTNRFNLYREFQLLSLVAKFLYGGLELDYNSVFRDTFRVASKILGFKPIFENKIWIKPSITIHKTIGLRLIDVINDALLAIPHSKPEFVFIDGKPVLTPDNEGDLLMELSVNIEKLRKGINGGD